MTDLELEHRDIGHGVTIRRAEEREYDQVGQVLLEAFVSSGKITELYRRRLLGITPRSETEDVWVAEDADGRIIGAYLTPKPDHLEEPDTFGFNTLGVLPAARGKGVGGAFVHHALDLARSYGLHKVLIHSGPGMLDAHRLYQHCGFVRHRELETLVVDGGQRLLVFIYEIEDD